MSKSNIIYSVEEEAAWQQLKELQELEEENYRAHMETEHAQSISDNESTGCPHCGSYEGDATECPECGHGQ